jgi:hypothetical protein
MIPYAKNTLIASRMKESTMTPIFEGLFSKSPEK